MATFTYSSSSPGTDTIQASFINSQNSTVTSTQVTKTWAPDFVIPETPLGTIGALVVMIGATALLMKRTPLHLKR